MLPNPTSDPPIHGRAARVAKALAVMQAAALAAAAPDVTVARYWTGDPTGAKPVALTGPITTDARGVSSLTLYMAFDEPLIGFRRVDVVGGRLDFTNFVAGRNWMTVDVSGIENGVPLSVTVADAVSADGMTPANTVRLDRRDLDFFPDAVRDINDVLTFSDLVGNGDLAADGTLDGVVDINDILWFGERYDQPGGYANSAPLITQPADTFAAQGRFSRWVPFTVRDDVTPEDDLAVTVSSSPAGLLPGNGVQLEGNGPQRRVRFFGAGSGVGVATVTVRVSDGVRHSTARFSVKVGPDAAPTARVVTRDFLGVAPLTADFSAESSSDEQDNIASYAWFINDTPSLVGPTLRHTFTQPGTYRVTCRVTDDSGLSSTDTRIVTVAAAPHNNSAPVSAAEARRFLWQAAFGPTDAAATRVTQLGYAGWINEQLATPANYFTNELMAQNEVLQGVPATPNNLWEDFIVEGADQLRQRIAWALIQTAVIDTTDSADGDRWLYNIYIKHALGDAAQNASGNYRELLEELTYSAAMGDYLTYRDNRKADNVLNTTPDENYARELLQLFTIGLWLLEPNGTRVKDIFGQDVPSHDSQDVGQFARIFTGLTRSQTLPPDVPLVFGPMRFNLNDHEFNEKTLLTYPGVFAGAAFIPASPATLNNARRDITVALDNLVDHPSFAPNLATMLIKRFVTSNPTRGYVARVAQAITGFGPYGSGERGDLRAAVRAILLDDEARNPAYRSNPMYGRVMEPQAVLAGANRALGIVRHPTNPFPHRIRLNNASGSWNTDTGQGFMRSPSVFNFYRPEYAPAGSVIADAGLSAPELQIFTNFTATAQIDQWRMQIVTRETEWDPALYQRLVTLSADPQALVNEFERLLVAGSLTAETEAILVNAIGQLFGERDRIRSTAYLLLANPEFRVLR